MKNSWIKCTDALPDREKTVLVRWNCGTILLGAWNCEINKWWSIDMGDYFDKSLVTHWQPLEGPES